MWREQIVAHLNSQGFFFLKFAGVSAFTLPVLFDVWARRTRFEWARSVHLQASNHAWPSRSRRASPVSVLTCARYFAASQRNHQPRAKPWPRRTCRWRVASPAYSFGPGSATATRSRAAPRRTTRSRRKPTQGRKKNQRAFTSAPHLFSVPAFPPLSRSPAAYRCPSRPWPPSGRPAPAAAAARVPRRPALTVGALVSASLTGP